MQNKLTGTRNPNDEEDEYHEEEEGKPKRICKTTKATEVANKDLDKGEKKDKASAKSKAKVKGSSDQAPATVKESQKRSTLQVQWMM